MQILKFSIGAIFFVIGCATGFLIPYADQLPIYDSIRNTSAIIFGVIGAWYAVLAPQAIGATSITEKGQGEAKDLLQRLNAPLKYSVYILSYVLLVQVLKPFASLIIHDFYIVQILRGLSFGILCFAVVLQLWTLLLSLVPNDHIMTEISKIYSTKKVKKDSLGSRNTHSK